MNPVKPTTEALRVARRRWLKQFALVAALTPAGLSGLIRDVLAKGTVPITPGIQRLTGDVRLNGEPAHMGMRVGPGDTLSTGPGAEVIYVIDQDAYLQRERTIVSFDTEVAKKIMRVITGKILSVFGKGSRTITTSTATIGIRGTGCYIEDEPATPVKVSAGGTALHTPSRTYFCLCYGEVELTPTAAPQEATRYQTAHHDHPLYIYDDMNMPTMMVDASVINHSDAELTLLEALVGRTTPFARRGGAY